MKSVQLFGVYFQGKNGPAMLCDVDGGICFAAHRTMAAAEADAAQTEEMTKHHATPGQKRYSVKPIEAGQLCHDSETDSIVIAAEHAAPVPVAIRAHRLTGPSWHDKTGRHQTAFHRINMARDGEPRREGWQVVDYCNGQLCQVVDMPDVLAEVCDTATGALWACREIVAHWMRSDVRSTRGH